MTETRTTQHPALIAIQTIRNEGTRMYETSDEFLTAELAANTNKVIAAVDAARKAGLEFALDSGCLRLPNGREVRAA